MQEVLRALVGGRGTAVTWARTRRELEHHLRHDPPDLLYVYDPLDDQGRLTLGRSEGDRHSLGLAELAGLLERMAGRPLLWLNLVVLRPAPSLWQPLLPHCRLLLGRQAEPIDSGAATAADLALLDRLQDGECDLPALICAAGGAGVTLVQAEACIALHFPGAETGGERALRARIRAALLRLLLGREPEKHMLHGYVTGAADGDLIAYVAVGDEQACVHDFPAQVRHRLEQRLDDGIRVVTRYVTAALDRGATGHGAIQRLFGHHLMPAGEPLPEALEHLLRHPALGEEKRVIALPWLLDLPREATAQAVGDWIGEWAGFHARVLAGSIPDGCLVLLGACLRTEPDPAEPPQALLQAANDALGRVAPAGGRFEPVRLREPLGRLAVDQLHRFFSQGRLAREPRHRQDPGRLVPQGILRHFEQGRTVGRGERPPPLVVITSNGERRLPDAFLRRCVVHHIELSDKLLEDILDAWQVQFPRLDKPTRDTALDLFKRIRDNRKLSRTPGAAELIVWLAALSAQGVQAPDLAGVPLAKLPALACLIKDHDDYRYLDRGA